MDLNQALNCIYYGPPGTGKTYSCIRKAVQIIEQVNDSIFEKDYSQTEVENLYKKYQADGRIAFMTFHPSFAYEDFVEGLKPFRNEKEDLYYDVEDGIFKQLSISASYALYLTQQHRLLDNRSSKSKNFDALYFEFIDYLKRMMLEEAKEVIFETKMAKAVYLVNINQNSTISLSYEQGERTYQVTKSVIAKLYRKFDSTSHLDKERDTFTKLAGASKLSLYRAVFDRLKSFENTRDRTYRYLLNGRKFMGQQVQNELYLHMKKEVSHFDFQGLHTEDYKKTGNFVLIIDEINRGNLPAIMGELITLIEPDKRAGQAHAISTILPYSKESFSVPKNLYILGSMNTVDRSITNIDTAMRRRFYFKEVAPLPNLLNEKHNNQLKEEAGSYHTNTTGGNKVDLQRLLTVINSRLTSLLDKEHTVGHAYLMPVLSSEDPNATLQYIFYEQLIPLFEEYFFNDNGKLHSLLGDDFFSNSNSNGVTKNHVKDYPQDTPIQLKLVKLEGNDFANAIINIYKHDSAHR